MKNFALLLLLTFSFLTSCDERDYLSRDYPKYELTTRTYVVDSNKAKVVAFTLQMLDKRKVHTKVNDDRDYSDEMEEASEIATKLYQTENLVLYKHINSSTVQIIYPQTMTKSEKEIFNRLLNE